MKYVKETDAIKEGKISFKVDVGNIDGSVIARRRNKESKRFVIYVRPFKTQRYEPTGLTYSRSTIIDAKNILLKRNDEVKVGLGIRAAKPNTVTVQEAFKSFLSSKRIADRTVDNYNSMYRVLFRKSNGSSLNFLLDETVKKDNANQEFRLITVVREYLAHTTAKPLSIKAMLLNYQGFLRYLYKEKLISREIDLRQEIYAYGESIKNAVTTREFVRYSAEEVNTVYLKCLLAPQGVMKRPANDVRKTVYFGLHWLLCYYTGFRAAEPLALKFDAIDWDNRRISIKHKTISRYDTFPMTDKVTRLLKILRKLSVERNVRKEYIFPYSNTSYVRDYINHILTEIGIKTRNKSFHALRKTLADDLDQYRMNHHSQSLLIDDTTIKHALRHSMNNDVTYSHYRNSQEEITRKALEAIGR